MPVTVSSEDLVEELQQELARVYMDLITTRTALKKLIAEKEHSTLPPPTLDSLPE